jgi:hypothetical protein
MLLLHIFHMSQYDGGPNDHISNWHLVEHIPNIPHVPAICVHVNTTMITLTLAT